MKSFSVRKSDLLQKMEKTDLRWRKQITARVKAILKRLKRLENEMKIERNFTKVIKKNVSSSLDEKTELFAEYIIFITN